MTLLAVTLCAALAQTVTPAPSAAEQAALRAAEAAERSAQAMERLANTLAPPPADPAATKPAAPSAWIGSVGLGLSFLTGNAQSLTMTAAIAADRKWEVWSLGIRAQGAYGTANPSAIGTGAVNARRAGGSIRGDRRFGSLVSIFAQGSVEFDHMKNIESRTTGDLGASLTLLNVKEVDFERLFLKLDLGLRAGYETRHQYFGTPGPIDPYGAPILAPRAAVAFRWSVSKDVRISEDIEFMPYLLAASPTQPAGRLLINNTTKLSARLTEMVSLTTALVLNYDSAPPQPAMGPQRVSTDVALTVGAEAVF